MNNVHGIKKSGYQDFGKEGERMDENASKLFRQIIMQAEVVVEEDYKQLSVFDNVILAGKENKESFTGFSFLIVQRDQNGNIIFRGLSEEFQNALVKFVLRVNLSLNIPCN